MVFPPPVRVQLWDSALRLIEVECEYFRKLGDGKRSIRHGEALKHSIRVRLVGPPDLHHNPLVRPVEGLRKFVQSPPEALRKTLLQCFELTEHPSKPGSIVRRSSQDEGDESSYIPSAFSESVSTTIFLSSSLHRFIIVSSESEYTTDLT
jgi:hypothetical protein